jgi:undecaprenyl pyrophosphate phosphatase UppP
MLTARQLMLALLLGTLLAIVCAYAGTLLTPPAMARWSVQMNEQEELRAELAMLGIRHLPMFLMSVAIGNWMYTVIKNTSFKVAALTAAPYILYVVGTGISESLDIGEQAFSWLTYEPAYFIWPHFIAVPAGLYAASRMVKRRKSV